MEHKGVFFLIILSHGTLVNNKDTVLGIDDKPVIVNQLETLFCASNCPSLDGVPKIFLVDSFRDDKGFTPEPTERMTSLKSFANASYEINTPHFIIVYASTFGNIAHLTNSGSQFSRTFVKVIAEATPGTSFTQIIREVKARVQISNTHQIVESVDHLTRNYFIKRYCC